MDQDLMEGIFSNHSSYINKCLKKCCQYCVVKIKQILKGEASALRDAIDTVTVSRYDERDIIWYTQQIHKDYYAKIVEVAKSHQCYNKEQEHKKTLMSGFEIFPPTVSVYSFFAIHNSTGPRMCSNCDWYDNHWGWEFFTESKTLFVCYTCCEESRERLCKESECTACGTKGGCAYSENSCDKCISYVAQKTNKKIA